MNTSICMVSGNYLIIARNLWQEAEILEFADYKAARAYARMTQMQLVSQKAFLSLIGEIEE